MIVALENYLREAGYETISATDGRSGMEALEQGAADICAILLDRTMPELDGMGFMRELNADPALVEIPVIMQTSRTRARGSELRR